MLIDLHTHSNASDGTDSPAQLVDKAITRGIDILALTDHDTTHGWIEAERALLEHPSHSAMKLVCGAEISCQDESGISIHILGLLFDDTNSDLISVLERTRENRVARMGRIIARLNEAGIDISIEDVQAQLREGATLGRPHLADALVAKGMVASRDEAFAELLHNRSKFYISHYSPSPTEAISLIKGAGGVAVIAHPLATSRGRTIDIDAIDAMVVAGLDGIEVGHRDHSEDERAALFRFAIERKLVVTGSSDYHGSGKENRLAEFTTHPEQWEALQERARGKEVISR